MLMGPDDVPQWCPDDWYVWDYARRPMKAVDRRNVSQTYGCLSPWNADAMAYRLDFTHRLCDHYSADDVLVISGLSREGETLLPPAFPCTYDPAAVASYRGYTGDAHAIPNVYRPEGQAWLADTLTPIVVENQRIICEANPWRECWLAFHPVFTQPRWQASGVTDITQAWRVVLREVRPRAAGHIIFSYFDNGFDAYAPTLVRELQALGVGVVTGSEWCEGLVKNTPAAVRLNLRALLTAPIHAYTMRECVEPWMVDAVRDSRAAWMARSEL
jgi:hypothetical protein